MIATWESRTSGEIIDKSVKVFQCEETGHKEIIRKCPLSSFIKIQVKYVMMEGVWINFQPAGRLGILFQLIYVKIFVGQILADEALGPCQSW